MNNARIVDWVDSLFVDVEQTDKVLEQKEELQMHLTDRIKDYMANSMDFNEAFRLATADLGDVDELVAGFKKERAASKQRTRVEWDDDEDDDWDEEEWDDFDDNSEHNRGLFGWKLTALSPFIFLGLGFAFGWWAWAWVIIPVSAILETPMKKGHKIVSLSPFVFVLMGFAFGWWAWGWIIIPVSAILFHDK